MRGMDLYEEDNPSVNMDGSDTPESEPVEDELLSGFSDPSGEEQGLDVAEYMEGEEGRAWYVVHCYSGYENKVRHNLEQRIETMGMKDKIFDVIVPTEEEIEVKEGKRRTVERRVSGNPGKHGPERRIMVRGA
jgi:transcriptional antiterminator NusG